MINLCPISTPDRQPELITCLFKPLKSIPRTEYAVTIKHNRIIACLSTDQQTNLVTRCDGFISNTYNNALKQMGLCPAFCRLEREKKTNEINKLFRPPWRRLVGTQGPFFFLQHTTKQPNRKRNRLINPPIFSPFGCALIHRLSGSRCLH